MFFRKAKTTSNDNTPVVQAPTYVGRNTTIEGVISTDGELQINGTVRGSVRARLCFIDSDGTVEGEAEADEVIVRGRVAGPIRGNHVHLREGAQVEGDIISQTIAVDNGARLQGAVWQSASPLDRAEPELPVHDGHRLLGGSLWSSLEDASYRPLKAIRPR